MSTPEGSLARAILKKVGRGAYWLLWGVVSLLGLGMLGIIVGFIFEDELTDKPEWKDVPVATSPSVSLGVYDETLAVHRLGPEASAVVGFGVCTAPFVAVFVLSAVRARRSARLARAALASGQDGETVVSGVAESLDDDASPLVDLRIRQQGSQRFDGSILRHKWAEVERRIVARPFGVRRADGTLVEVVLGEDPILDLPLTEMVTELDGEAKALESRALWTMTLERVRRASLMSGATVHVRGALSAKGTRAPDSVYRDHANVPVLSKPISGRLIVSTKPLGRLEREDAAFQRRCMMAVGVLSVLVSLSFLRSYELLLVDGDAVAAKVDGMRAWKWQSGSQHGSPSWERRNELRAVAELADGTQRTVTGKCSDALYWRVASGEPMVIPVVISRHFPGTYELGAHAGLTDRQAGFAAAATGAFWLVFWFFAWSRPGRPELGEKVVDEGVGALNINTA